MNASRYFHTLRHLKPAQVVARVQFGLRSPRPDLRPAPALRRRSGYWQSAVEGQRCVLEPGRFRFLNSTHHIESPEGWHAAPVSRLWLYNLHYHDALKTLGRDEQRALQAWLVREWVQSNPPGEGAGWEPYPTSLRVVNWMRWVLAGGELSLDSLHNLAVQVRWLSRRLETHLLGNHLWANAKALLFAGVFFEGEEARRWLDRGLALFRRELGEQVLADGGHFERSPMYQATLAEDLLDMCNLAHALPGVLPEAFVGQVSACASSMLRWLRVMSHPDGGVSFFNDAAFGVAPDYAALRDYALRLGVTVDDAPLNEIEALADSGYVRLQTDRAVLICDVAPVGPDYQPGHAHADTLSFELSLDGRRLFVNSGTSTYDGGPLRSWQRSTAAHNTVDVDGENSSEVWAAFRVARRARPREVGWRREDEGLAVEGAHDGYRRLRGRVMHRRRWVLRDDGLLLEDTLEGTCREAVARLHLHPDVSVQHGGALLVNLLQRGQEGTDPVCVSVDGASELTVREGSWYPEFNLELSNHQLCATFASERLITRVKW